VKFLIRRVIPSDDALTSSGQMGLIKEKIAIAVVLLPVLLLLMLGAAMAVDPRFSLESLGYPGCLMQRCFGIPCPLCGGMEAFTAGMRGDFATAWAANPFALLLLLTMIVVAFGLAVALVSPRSIKPLLRKRITAVAATVWGILLLIVLVFNWLARVL
jgi:hypothetical protein